MQSPGEVEQIFNTVKPNGVTPTGTRIHTILNDYLHPIVPVFYWRSQSHSPALHCHLLGHPYADDIQPFCAFVDFGVAYEGIDVIIQYRM